MARSSASCHQFGLLHTCPDIFNSIAYYVSLLAWMSSGQIAVGKRRVVCSFRYLNLRIMTLIYEKCDFCMVQLKTRREEAS